MKSSNRSILFHSCLSYYMHSISFLVFSPSFAYGDCIHRIIENRIFPLRENVKEKREEEKHANFRL